MLDTVIRGGWVVTPHSEGHLDIGIAGERIASVGSPGLVPVPEGAAVIDAAGKVVTPGGIESHAHIHEPMYRGWTGGADVWLQPPEGATRAAAFGGTTTVLSFAFLDVHVTDRAYDTTEAVAQRREIFTGRSFVDFAFHPVITGSASAETLASIATTIDQGTPSFKVFTTDVTTGQAGIRIDHGSVLAAMRIAQEAGGIVMVHAEDDDLIKYNEARLKSEGRNQLQNIRCAHTPFGEALAFRQVAALAAEAGAAAYFVHTTAGESVGVVAGERRRGRPVYAETLHNLLCFSEEDYLKPDGARYHIGMGLPSPEDRAQLWEGVTGGDIATVATDEYTTSLDVKLGGHDIETVPGGHVGIETRGTILLSEGHKRGRLSLRRFVELFATNPARIFGLYPRKGVIEPGADADLAIWDLDVERTITMADLHHDGDYSPWEGWEVSAWPVMTVLRGKPIVSGGELRVGADYGQWQPRTIDPEILEHPVVT
ncbi:MAG: amidohydrolase family protein [bacterium]|nr:amidohydrolase family protein [bacterium]